MATESPLIHDGSQTVLSTAADARRSSITGSTLPGPNGSGQFLVVQLSTTVDRTVTVASTAPGVYPAPVYGILQNTPGPGQAADVGIFGVSKAVTGSTSFVRGALLCASSTLGGTVSPWSSGGVNQPTAIALETPTATAAVISVFWYAGINKGTS